jgi:flagellar protein FlgJ
MAIQVASDIVLDVIKAANPIRVRHAAAKLGAAGEITASFDRELGKAQRAQGIASELRSDIVMDVIAAADPAGSVTARDKLASLANGEFARPQNLAGLREMLDTGTPRIKPTLDPSNIRKTAYRDFEASVLKSFFETMLPSTDGGFYGQGTAGNVWRSMNADYLAQEFAKAGGIGIAQQLERKTGDSKPAAPITSAPQWPYFSQPSISGIEL